MSSLVISLGGVVVLEILLFSAAYRWGRFTGKQTAFMIASLVVAVYLPFGIRGWRGLDYFAIHFAFYVMIPYVLGIITSHWEARQQAGAATSARWFHWGPAVLVGFFLILAVGDGMILNLAENGLNGSLAERFLPRPRSNANVISVFPGSVSHDFKEKEAQFNEYVSARQQQQTRGWRVRKGWLGTPVVNQPEVFKLTVEDRFGKPVANALVTGQFLRASNAKKDVNFTMKEAKAGEYRVALSLPEPGRWSLVAWIRRGNERHEIRAATVIADAIRPELQK